MNHPQPQFLYDYPLECVTYEEHLRRDKAEFINNFPRKHLKNPVTRESYIKKLHQFEMRKNYPNLKLK